MPLKRTVVASLAALALSAGALVAPASAAGPWHGGGFHGGGFHGGGWHGGGRWHGGGWGAAGVGLAAGALAGAALAANPKAIVLAHGGPLTAPDVVRNFLVRSRCHGYATGSSAERSPVIQSVAQTIRDFARPLPEKRRGAEP